MQAIKNQGVLSHRLLRRTLTAALAVATTLSLLANSGIAQRFKSTPVKLAGKEASSLKGQVTKALRNTAAFQSDGTSAIDNYYNKYYFPQLSQTSPKALANLGRGREILLRDLRGAKVPAAQAHLTKTSLTAMNVLARDRYHPAVRYNAALILGMLDKQYATSGANATDPIVLPEATNGLLELLEQDEFKGVKVHPSVKVAALVGLERHLRFGMDPQYAPRVTKAAMAVLAQESSALQVNEDVNSWMKCQAARVLVLQSKSGPSKELQTALTALIADDKMGLEDRCCIAGLFEKMEYAGAADVDLAATVLPLGKLTQAVVAEGAEKAQEFIDLILGDPNARQPRRRNFGIRGNEDEGPKLERRQLLSRLSLIEKGATALVQGLTDDEKQKIQSLTALLAPVLERASDKKELDLDVAEDVDKLQNSVDNLLASWQPAAAAPTVDALAEPESVE